MNYPYEWIWIFFLKIILDVLVLWKAVVASFRGVSFLQKTLCIGLEHGLMSNLNNRDWFIFLYMHLYILYLYVLFLRWTVMSELVPWTNTFYAWDLPVMKYLEYIRCPVITVKQILISFKNGEHCVSKLGASSFIM